MAKGIDRRLQRLERAVKPTLPVKIHVVLLGEDGNYSRPQDMTEQDVLIRVTRESIKDNEYHHAPSIVLDR